MRIALACVLVFAVGCRKQEHAKPSELQGSAVVPTADAAEATGSGSAEGSAAGSGDVAGSAGSGDAAGSAAGSAAAGGDMVPDAPPAKDKSLIAALQKAGVKGEDGAGKTVWLVENLDCSVNSQGKPSTHECSAPAAKGAAAKAVIAALVDRKVEPVKEHGDVVVYKLANVRCRSLNEAEKGTPKEDCELTK
jgi:hypothetical protein